MYQSDLKISTWNHLEFLFGGGFALKNTKTYRLLQLLALDERPKFIQFLQSSDSKGKRRLKRLAELLFSNMDGEPGALTWLEAAQKVVKQGHPHLEKTALYQLLHQLKIKAEHFLLLQTLAANPLEHRKLLTLTFLQRQASAFLLESVAKQRKLAEALAPNAWFFREMVELNVISHNHPGNLKTRASAPSIQKINDALDCYWITARLANNWNAWLEATYFGTVNEATKAYLLQPLELLRNKPELQSNPFAKAYALAVTTALEEKINIENYERLREQAILCLPNSESSELIGVFNMLINYLTLAISNEGEVHLPKLLDLYRQGLKIGAFYKHGYLGYGDFTNMIHNACKSGDIEFAEEILHKQAKFLEESEREAALRISKVRIAFFKADYQEALRMLNQSSTFLSDTDKLYDKVMRVFCYYETQELDLLDAALEAFRKFIKRRPMLAGKYFEPLTEFIKILKLLSNSPSHSDLAQLMERSPASPKAAYWSWLKEKIEAKMKELSTLQGTRH